MTDAWYVYDKAGRPVAHFDTYEASWAFRHGFVAGFRLSDKSSDGVCPIAGSGKPPPVGFWSWCAAAELRADSGPGPITPGTLWAVKRELKRVEHASDLTAARLSILDLIRELLNLERILRSLAAARPGPADDTPAGEPEDADSEDRSPVGKELPDELGSGGGGRVVP